MKINRKKLYLIFIALLISMPFFFAYQNNAIVISPIEIASNKIPSSFNDFTIVQISDLHNKRFGKEQSRIIKKIEQCNPNVIFITGDLIDSKTRDLSNSKQFISKAIKIAAVYFVTGNHEIISDYYAELKAFMLHKGVVILDNESQEFTQNNDKILLLGLADPLSYNDRYMEQSIMNETLNTLAQNNGDYIILLSHRPEHFDIYVNNNIDLVFCGHAHGGQIRLPIVGGLIAPNQGFFPQYTSGVYRREQTSMIVSRGLGNSIIPLRLFNRPEIIVLKLKAN